MAKTLYKAKFENPIKLGGIAAEHITLAPDGSLAAPSAPVFAIKAEGGSQGVTARLLQGGGNGDFALPSFESTISSSYFPFAEISLSDSSFPALISLSAFSPFIPLNDTDSGIPAVCFEFEVSNCSEQTLDFSIACVSHNTFENPLNEIGCTDTGEAYIYFKSCDMNGENHCIATNSKNVSFCRGITSPEAFIQQFSTSNESTDDEYGSYGALCSHFSLESGQSSRICFCISVYKVQNHISRNYYAQYFESSLECCSYFFRQMTRLKGACSEFCSNIFASTLPESVLEEVNRDLFSFLSQDMKRLDDGVLVYDKEDVFNGFDGFISRAGILASLFPELDYSRTRRFFAHELYENAHSEKLIMTILNCYRHFILCGNTEQLIEDWYYIVKCMNLVFTDEHNAKGSADTYLQSACLEAAAEMAKAVKDKKRYEAYSSRLYGFPLSQSSIDFASGFAKLNEISGFTYSAADKHIGFSPDSASCPLDVGDTFRCFFCTPSCYGYVEEGIDYLEINLLYGELTLRSFSVPRVPRLVQYAGRNWRFENKNLTCVLDTALEITPQKKLTIFIDIKQ